MFTPSLNCITKSSGRKAITTLLVHRFAPERTQPPEYNAGKPVSSAFRVCLGASITTSDDRKKSCTGALAARVTPVSSPRQGGIKHVFSGFDEV